MIKKLLPFLILLMAPALQAQCAGGGTCNLSSPSSSAFQAALNSVNTDGTVVNVTGNITLNNVTWVQTNSIVIQGTTTVTGTCAPANQGGTCVPTDGTVINGPGGAKTLSIVTLAGKSLRVTGIEFIIPFNATAVFGDINISGGSTSVRFDHDHFFTSCGCTSSGGHLFQWDANPGVVDHSYFDAPPNVTSNPNTIGTNVFFFQVTNTGSDGTGNATWAQPDGFGGSNFLFVENDWFQNGTFVADTDFGGRAVYRYDNIGPTTRIQTHGTGSAPPKRSGRAVEMYNNNFAFVSSPTAFNSFGELIDLEGGTGLEWGNAVSGFTNFIVADVVRTEAPSSCGGVNGTYCQTAVPSGFGYCATSPIGGVAGPSPWDSSGSGPCLDNIGRGQGDLVNCATFSTFPCNNTTTGTPFWTHEVLSPHYSFLNVVSPVPSSTTNYWNVHTNTGIGTLNNREYYFDCGTYNSSCSSFTGAAGTGNGLLSARPSSCTAGVGYWATDTQTLYTCNSGGNAWTAYYTPYTYPHPLVTGGSVTPPTNGAFGTIMVGKLISPKESHENK